VMSMKKRCLSLISSKGERIKYWNIVFNSTRRRLSISIRNYLRVTYIRIYLHNKMRKVFWRQLYIISLSSWNPTIKKPLIQ
jgi:hypothetical protein